MIEGPSNTERILRVVNGLKDLEATQMASFTYFFLGSLTGLVRQHPGKLADDLVNDLQGCAGLFGIQAGSFNAEALKNWTDTLHGVGKEAKP